MNNLASIMFLALLTEALVDYFGEPIPKPYKKYVAAALGILMAFGFGADLFLIFGMPARAWWITQLLTGVTIGRGSNYLASGIRLLQGLKESTWLSNILRSAQAQEPKS